MQWSYILTTVPSRFETTLPKTLASLANAGFDNPFISIDDCKEAPEFIRSKYEYSCTYRRLHTAEHWYLSAVRAYLMDPNADRYAIFQDDFVTYANLRLFLETKLVWQPRSYYNLYTFPSNEHGTGWHVSNQRGLGAVALVFDNEGLRLLLQSKHMVDRPKDPKRGHHSIDGGIVEAFKKVGYKEWVHSPSLTQHIGEQSSMGNRKHPKAVSFRGEDFDALRL